MDSWYSISMLNAAVLGQFGDLSFLNHALVPFRRAPVYLRLVSTKSRALDYAAGGFHVSVTRGAGGGCYDPATSIPTGTAGKCASPIGRQELGNEWATVAEKYKRAFESVSSLGLTPGTRTMLMEANASADRVYGMENVPPPRDPVTGTSEAPMAKPTMPTKHKALIATGLLGLLGVFVGGVAAVQGRM